MPLGERNCELGPEQSDDYDHAEIGAFLEGSHRALARCRVTVKKGHLFTQGWEELTGHVSSRPILTAREKIKLTTLGHSVIKTRWPHASSKYCRITTALKMTTKQIFDPFCKENCVGKIILRCKNGLANYIQKVGNRFTSLKLEGPELLFARLTT